MTGVTTGSVAETPQEPYQTDRPRNANKSNMKYCKACGSAITAKYRSKYCSNECSANKRHELAKEYQRQYHKNNPEKANEISRRWSQNNPEKARESKMRWQKNHPEKVREYNRRHDAKRRKIIKENTERWVENYMAKVREGARMEREAEEKNTGINGRQPNKEVGIIADGVKTI